MAPQASRSASGSGLPGQHILSSRVCRYMHEVTYFGVQAVRCSFLHVSQLRELNLLDVMGRHALPSRRDAAQQLHDLVLKHPHHNVVIGVDKLGKGEHSCGISC